MDRGKQHHWSPRVTEHTLLVLYHGGAQGHEVREGSPVCRGERRGCLRDALQSREASPWLPQSRAADLGG